MKDKEGVSLMSDRMIMTGTLKKAVVFAWFLGALLCVAGFVRAGYLHGEDLRVRTEKINTENSNLARSLAHNVNRTFSQADGILLFMKTAIEANGVVDPAHLQLLRTFLADKGIAQIAVADAGGDLIFSAMPINVPLNISDREHFQAHVGADTGRAFVALPKAFELWDAQAIFLSRRINDQDGNFGGVVSVGLAPEYFAEVFHEMDIGPDKSIALLRTDGALLARVPPPFSTEHAQYFRTHIALSLLAGGSLSGRYESTGVGGTIRFGSFQALSEYPALVLVATPKNVALIDAASRVRAFYVGAVIFSLLIIVALSGLTWLGRKYIRAQNLLMLERNAYRDLSDRLRGEIEQEYLEKEKFNEKLHRLDRLNLIGEMAASIGHEVRNPLTTTRGYLQFFGRKEVFAPYKESFRLMIEELDRANSIITEFLSLAKNKKVDIRLANLNGTILALKPMLEADAIRSGHELVFDLGDTPDILMDDSEVRQLVINLVRNGLEAMTKGGRLTIGTAARGGEVLLAINDSGPGIPPQAMGKLGTPFFTTKEKGTGLGLAVSYRIADRHKATLSFDSSPEGTTVTVRFRIPGE